MAIIYNLVQKNIKLFRLGDIDRVGAVKNCGIGWVIDNWDKDPWDWGEEMIPQQDLSLQNKIKTVSPLPW